jgi:hypothetical protein
LQDYYLLGVFFSLDKPSDAEFEQIVNSIQVVPSKGDATRR